MLFLLQPVFRCPEKGLLGDVYSPPDNDRSHDVQVSQVKMMFKILKSERKLRKHWYFSWTTHSHRIGTLVLIVHDCADHLLELAKMFRYTHSHKYHCQDGQDIPVYALSQISLPFIFFMLVRHYTVYIIFVHIVCVWQVHALPENLRRRFRPLCHHLGCHQVGFYCLTHSTNSAGFFWRTARLVLWGIP